MGDGPSGEIAFPDVFAAVREALESEQVKVQKEADDLRRKVGRDEAALLLRLRRATAILDPAYEEPAPPTSARRGRRRRGVGAKENPAVKAKRARESIYRFIVERGEAVQAAEVRDALGLSLAVVRNGLGRMVSEGLIEKVEGGGYGAAGKAGSWSAERKGETAQGLILVTLEDRGWASPAELAQLLRIPVDKAEEEAAVLIVEGEIRWAQRGDRKGYVLAGTE